MTDEDGIILSDSLISDTKFGAVPAGNGKVIFTAAVLNAKKCSLVLYKKGRLNAEAVIPMKLVSGNVFQVIIDNKKYKSDCYMYQADGREFLDPYAEKVTGRERFGYRSVDGDKALERGCIVTSVYEWMDDQPVTYRWPDTILYKLHVRGFTKAADVPHGHKGTYLGIADMASYFNELGVNTLLLMPCVEFNEIMNVKQKSFGGPENFNEIKLKNMLLDKPEDVIDDHIGINADKRIIDDYKVNYWGYTEDYQYFAPKASYAAKPDEASIEFKYMINILHRHKISVLMEMEFGSKVPINIIIDSLKYWAACYHIDGFKISIDPAFNAAVLGEPWLSDKKLIMNGLTADHKRYDAGRSLKRLAVYDDGFKCDARMFLKGDDGKAAAYLDRTSKGETAAGIINYIADQNGFTLIDLYSYDHKHNEDNDEENKDGSDCNFGWNCGIEGMTRKKDISALRLKLRRNAMAALLFSQGTPMIYAGDEFGNSQQGNNNAYCQDNRIGWLDWKAKKKNDGFFEFVKQLIGIRMQHIMLHYPTELRRMDYISCGYPDITFHGRKAWYTDYSGHSRALGVLLCGRYAELTSGSIEKDIYIVYNMHWEPHIFDLPSMSSDTEWKLMLSTEEDGNMITSAYISKNIMLKPDKGIIKQYIIAPRSIALFTSMSKH